MAQYFFSGEDICAEEIHRRIFWYRPAEEIHRWVMVDGPRVVVKDTDGGAQSADEFWKWAGDLEWDYSRLGQTPRPPPRIIRAVAS